MRDQFEAAAYKIEDNVGKRPIQGRELIEEIRYVLIVAIGTST